MSFMYTEKFLQQIRRSRIRQIYCIMWVEAPRKNAPDQGFDA